MSQRESVWVKCDDMMPSPVNGNIVFWVIFGKYWESGRFDGEVWVSDRTDGSDDAITYSTEQVSHWMEIHPPDPAPRRKAKA
jgi:hypothetical protein